MSDSIFSLNYLALCKSSPDFAAKLRLKHEGANNVRKVAEEILYNGLMNLDVELVQCKKNRYTEIYDKEARELLMHILEEF